MFVSNMFFIIYTRHAISLVKNPKEESPKVSNKYTKSDFSNFDCGRPVDQECVCQCFFKGNLGLAVS